MEHVRNRTLVRHTPLHALGDQLVDILALSLEVTVLRVSARLHRAERAHAPVLLEALATSEDHLARGLVGPGEESPGHLRVRARRDRLRHITGGAKPAVADHGHA